MSRKEYEWVVNLEGTWKRDSDTGLGDLYSGEFWALNSKGIAEPLMDEEFGWINSGSLLPHWEKVLRDTSQAGWAVPHLEGLLQDMLCGTMSPNPPVVKITVTARAPYWLGDDGERMAASVVRHQMSEFNRIRDLIAPGGRLLGYPARMDVLSPEDTKIQDELNYLPYRAHGTFKVTVDPVVAPSAPQALMLARRELSRAMGERMCTPPELMYL